MFKNKRILIILIIGYQLYGCHSVNPDSNNTAPPINLISNNNDITHIIESGFVTRPEYSNFSICYGHTCQYFSVLALTDDKWNKIRSIFRTPAVSAEQEREQIRAAIALLENMVGAMTGTSNDKAESFAGMGEEGQMDCVDEATNSSSYLTILQADNLLKWHTVDYRISRGISTFQVPHFTAVIREKESGNYFAVDSWFLANGEPPFIVPLTVWEKGWKPGDPF